jgi:hypothetical protein
MKDKWIPEVGVLMVRELVGAEKVLQFRDGEEDMHYQRIAVIRNGIAEAGGGGCIECVEGRTETTSYGRHVIRRLATQADVDEVALRWGRRNYSFGECVAKAHTYPTLGAEAKAMLSAAVAKLPGDRAVEMVE